jgi:acyl dehydratase
MRRAIGDPARALPSVDGATPTPNDPLDRIVVGAEARLSWRVTRADIEMFAALSGDVNPLHMDDAFARARGFERRLAHGMLEGALLSRILGTVLPGPGTLWLRQSFRFVTPVYAGDRVQAIVRVRQVSKSTRCVVLATELVKQGARPVLTGEAMVMIPAAAVRAPRRAGTGVASGGLSRDTRPETRAPAAPPGTA